MLSYPKYAHAFPTWGMIQLNNKESADLLRQLLVARVDPHLSPALSPKAAHRVGRLGAAMSLSVAAAESRCQAPTPAAAHGGVFVVAGGGLVGIAAQRHARLAPLSYTAHGRRRRPEGDAASFTFASGKCSVVVVARCGGDRARRGSVECGVSGVGRRAFPLSRFQAGKVGRDVE